jgi:hypothetical protein
MEDMAAKVEGTAEAMVAKDGSRATVAINREEANYQAIQHTLAVDNVEQWTILDVTAPSSDSSRASAADMAARAMVAEATTEEKATACKGNNISYSPKCSRCHK